MCIRDSGTLPSDICSFLLVNDLSSSLHNLAKMYGSKFLPSCIRKNTSPLLHVRTSLFASDVSIRLCVTAFSSHAIKLGKRREVQRYIKHRAINHTILEYFGNSNITSENLSFVWYSKYLEV